jgi:hypothetical protein
MMAFVVKALHYYVFSPSQQEPGLRIMMVEKINLKERRKIVAIVQSGRSQRRQGPGRRDDGGG